MTKINLAQLVVKDIEIS